MTPYVITFIVMVGVFMIGCFAFKLPVGVSMLIAALCGALEGGLGTETIRMMVEGEFGYVDTILTIGCAMIFMKVIEGSGALDALSSLIIEKFHRFPAVLLVLIMLIIMFPGMITGSSTAAVLSAGSIMAPVLALMGNRCRYLRLHYRYGCSAWYDRTSCKYRRINYLRRYRCSLCWFLRVRWP